ncbi:MAG: nitroreductase family protein [Candidatus Dojkabacteria bacterium]|nr:nitroreductase family protein [Candidatus Dojkabacteria bacterium]
MLDVILKRRSIRQYEDKPVEPEVVREVLLAAMCAPSAYHKNPWSFVLVEKEEIRERLSRATNFASFSKKAPIIIVITADSQSSPHWIEDSSIVGAHIYLEAVNQGLGTCWVQVYNMETPDGTNSEEYVRSVLGIPETERVLCMMPLGYPAEHPAGHSEASFKKDKVHTDRW